MFFKLLLLLTVVPALELYLLIHVGREIGVLATILIIIGTGALGAALARREGLRTLQAAQESLNRGAVPADAMIDGLLILLAGGVLLTPGFLTDLLGFLLLLPPLRAVVRVWLKHTFKDRITLQGMGTGGAGPFGPFSGGPRTSGPKPETDPFSSSDNRSKTQPTQRPDIVIPPKNDPPTDR